MAGKKIFILSATSLTSAPDTCLRFGSDNEVVIPGVVIDELGKIAAEYTEKGKHAKNVLTYLDRFSMSDLTSKEGVKQKNALTLRVEYGYSDISVNEENLSKNQIRRLQIAKGLKEQTKRPVTLISRNAAFRLRAKSLGIRAFDFEDEVFPTLDQQYRGRCSTTCSSESITYFRNHGFIELKKLHQYTKIEWSLNMFVELSSIDEPANKVIGRFDGEKIVKLEFEKFRPYEITPKNEGQKMLIEAMMTSSKEAPIVIAKGGAGTGKTYQTLACALAQVSDCNGENTYDQIMISTSVATVGGEQIGFLPGEIEDKFSPHIGGVRDNLRILLNGNAKRKRNGPNSYEDGTMFFENGIIQMQPIGFFRGRTIVNTFIIIDETQNIHPDDIKSIVSRVGEGSKIVFLGDPTQIDNPKLNEQYNGLVFLSEKMKDYKLAWQITLNDEESVRSELEKYAAKIL